MSIIEIVATIAGLVCVWLTVRQHIWCWPIGLVMVTLYIYIFYTARLYSDMGLQVIYVFLQIYGWRQWLYGGADQTPRSVVRLGRREGVFWCVVATCGTIGLGYIMASLTDAALPYCDATATVLSLVAQYLMAKKVLESWFVWIAVDVLSIGIYILKDLHLTAGLYAVFLCLAVMGFFAWRKTLGTTPVAVAA